MIYIGSGNTWLRLLIEYSTGVYTGSVYNDSVLAEILPAEGLCHHFVSAIKVHPHTHGYRYGDSPMAKGIASSNDACLNGGITSINKIILLVRNPFDAIWSEHQRRYTNSHSGKISNQDFDESSWYTESTRLAKQYAEMWVHFADIVMLLDDANILVVKHENLRSDRTVLDKILSFLGYDEINARKRDCVFQVHICF